MERLGQPTVRWIYILLCPHIKAEKSEKTQLIYLTGSIGEHRNKTHLHFTCKPTIKGKLQHLAQSAADDDELCKLCAKCVTSLFFQRLRRGAP